MQKLALLNLATREGKSVIHWSPPGVDYFNDYFDGWLSDDEFLFWTASCFSVDGQIQYNAAANTWTILDDDQYKERKLRVLK